MPGLMLVRARGRRCVPRQEAKESNHTGKISFDTISLTMWGWTPWAGDKMSRAKSMTGSGRKPKSKLTCGGSVRFSLWKGVRQKPETVWWWYRREGEAVGSVSNIKGWMYQGGL